MNIHTHTQMYKKQKTAHFPKNQKHSKLDAILSDGQIDNKLRLPKRAGNGF